MSTCDHDYQNAGDYTGFVACTRCGCEEPSTVAAGQERPEAALRSRIVWAMAAMDEAALLELVALAERLAPATAMATTYSAPAPPPTAP